MASTHYTRDNVGVVVTSINSLGSIPYQKYRDLGINLIYLTAQDDLATYKKRQEVVAQGFRCGLIYPANTEFQFGADVAREVSAALNKFTKNPATGKEDDSGQTPVILDFEPSSGSKVFWFAFNDVYRKLRPGRVTDFSPEPFKAMEYNILGMLTARYDVRTQYYFGDMAPADAGEVRADWIRNGYPEEAVRGVVDGGRFIKPPIFYEGRKVRNLEPGTIIFSANLLREVGLG